jgi:hypothetical protein
MKYGTDTTEIRPRQCTAWSVSLPDGRRLMSLFHKDATIQDVHHFFKIRHAQFTIEEIDVGEVTLVAPYIMVNGDQTYSSDGRRVDQDWNVVLHDPWTEPTRA